MNKGINIIFLLLFLFSCKGQDELNKDNPHIKEVKRDVLIYKMQYMPFYRSDQEGQGKGLVWFKIDLHTTENSSPLRLHVNDIGEYNTRLNYYLNEAKEDVELVYKGGKYKPEAYWFENNQNLTPFETILVGFNLPEYDALSPECTLSFYDRIFQQGIIKSQFIIEEF